MAENSDYNLIFINFLYISFFYYYKFNKFLCQCKVKRYKKSIYFTDLYRGFLQSTGEKVINNNSNENSSYNDDNEIPLYGETLQKLYCIR